MRACFECGARFQTPAGEWVGASDAPAVAAASWTAPPAAAPAPPSCGPVAARGCGFVAGATHSDRCFASVRNTDATQQRRESVSNNAHDSPGRQGQTRRECSVELQRRKACSAQWVRMHAHLLLSSHQQWVRLLVFALEHGGLKPPRSAGCRSKAFGGESKFVPNGVGRDVERECVCTI